MWTWFHRLASPPYFHALTERWAPWLGWVAAVLIGYGCVGGLLLAPPDYQQGDAFRIIYVHVPAAWLSMSVYMAMASAGVVAIIWRIKLAECVVVAAAPVGASFTALALATGMLWGKPMWGAYWVWDARLTSELVLLFIYLGVVGLAQAFEDARAASRACSLLAIVGVVNVVIVKYSVEWWNSLHQVATISRIGKPTISSEMLWPLLGMSLGFMALAAWAVLRRAQNELLWRERDKSWVREQLEQSDV